MTNCVIAFSFFIEMCSIEIGIFHIKCKKEKINGKMGDFSDCEILRSLDVAFSPSEIGDKGHLGEGGWKLEIYQSVELEAFLQS